MRRLFWLVMGVTIGAMIARRVSKAVSKLTPSGAAHSLARGLSDLAASIGEFAAEVRTAMQDREAELREGTGLDGALGKPG